MTADPPLIFNRRLVATRRRRSAASFSRHDFLHQRVVADISERLESINRNFPVAHYHGSGAVVDGMSRAGGVRQSLISDIAPERLKSGELVCTLDEECNPFAPGSFDLVVSILTLHAVNDLIGALVQHRNSLKPDGLFIAALFGEETLRGLKEAFYSAEIETRGGVSPRFAPLASVRDLGGALQRAGFAMPVADVDQITVRYSEPARLIRDLRGMGETGALARRPRALTKEIAAKAGARIPEEARFDIVYLTGWAPSPDQPKPLKPGSGKVSLETAVRGAGV